MSQKEEKMKMSREGVMKCLKVKRLEELVKS